MTPVVAAAVLTGALGASLVAVFHTISDSWQRVRDETVNIWR